MYMRVLRRIPIYLQASYEFTMSSHVLGHVRSRQRTCTHVRLIGPQFKTGRNTMRYKQIQVMVARIHRALAVCLLVSAPCYQTVLCKVENIGNSGWMSVDRSQHTTLQTYKTRIRECRLQAIQHNRNQVVTLSGVEHIIQRSLLLMIIRYTRIEYALYLISVCTNWILI